MTDSAAGSALVPYVLTAARLMEVPLDPVRASAVAAHLERTAAMARLLEECGTLDVEDEPAEIFCPAPFPLEGTP